ncbi:gamma-glutamylcyclotransferase family protein [Embleya sp. MST-111070]|uniref:gamma-glutamylcyclotransferase family protein n=1 Tax=Embleya sp. MST-111070 TaxID=3398231 RepID=UPI003F741073
MKPTTVQLPVFVYGTLRTGQGNYRRILAGNTARERAATLAGYKLLDGGVPFAVPSVEGDHMVVGDLMEVDPDVWTKVLRSLDRLEGYRGTDADLYVRKTCEVRTSDGDVMSAYVYIAGKFFGWDDDAPVVPGGDWVANSAVRHRSYGAV